MRWTTVGGLASDLGEHHETNFFSWWLVFVALAWCAGLPASADERVGRVKGSAKDPVETAFELPQGTRLTSAQAKALNKMRKNMSPSFAMHWRR